ncbi:hypothetical protein OEZ85_013668 [Tetradesmus obliquus]|uniref:Uncharacterized protein n=1 Tax=Tetradesmus obliquus TaxID=3088 RepID=A0ABY8UTQ4_TETOB|nr:hypothetical protein OEZ85_013668 [Tetradesmus obliquus]
MWGPSLYKEAGFRQVYTKKLFERRFKLAALVKGHARHHSLVPEFLQQRGSSRGFPASIHIKLLSIGCGPGVDAAALMACLRSLSCAGGSVEFLTGSFADERVNDAAAAADVVITSHVLVDMEKSGKADPAIRFFNRTMNSWLNTSSATARRAAKLIVYADRWQPNFWERSRLYPEDGLKHACVVLPGKKTCLGEVGLLVAAQQPQPVDQQKLVGSPAEPATTESKVVNSAATNPALHYPGWYGAHPEQCMQYICNPRTGLCTVAWPKLDGSPCKSGSCKLGKCVPDATACPPDPNKCSRYKYNNATARCELEVVSCPQQPPDACKMLRCKKSTGLCTALWNRPDNTTCPGGKCQSGACKPAATCPVPCPPHSNDCKVHVCDEATGKCSKETEKRDGTLCGPWPGYERGVCLAGDCLVGDCPPQPDPCMRWTKDFNGSCILEPAPDGTLCAGGTCKAGNCSATVNCTTPCRNHTDDCKKWQCNPSTGACNVEVNRPDNTSCTGVDAGFTCKGGVCKPAAACPICPPHPKECWRFVCNATTFACSIEQPKAHGEPCNFFSGPAACTGGNTSACVTWDCIPNPPKGQACTYWQWTSDIDNGCILKSEPDGSACSDGNVCTAGDTCKAGECIPGNSTAADGSACSDGDACMTDIEVEFFSCASA